MKFTHFTFIFAVYCVGPFMVRNGLNIKKNGFRVDLGSCPGVGGPLFVVLCLRR